MGPVNTVTVNAHGPSLVAKRHPHWALLRASFRRVMPLAYHREGGESRGPGRMAGASRPRPAHGVQPQERSPVLRLRPALQERHALPLILEAGEVPPAVLDWCLE